MHTFIDYIEEHPRLVEVLEELQRQGLLRKYEIIPNRNQIRIEPFSENAYFTLGVILGQFKEINEIPLGSFKKHKSK